MEGRFSFSGLMSQHEECVSPYSFLSGIFKSYSHINMCASIRWLVGFAYYIALITTSRPVTALPDLPEAMSLQHQSCLVVFAHRAKGPGLHDLVSSYTRCPLITGPVTHPSTQSHHSHTRNTDKTQIHLETCHEYVEGFWTDSFLKLLSI